MGRIRYTHNSFSIGILSKKIQGNTEFEGYNNSLDECENFQIQPTGGVFKRGGTKFVSEIAGTDAILILFCYSSSDQYMCEFGDKYIRFYTKYGKLIDENGKHVEISTEFLLKDIRNLKTFQSGNILYLVTDSGIYSLKRTSTTSFEISDKPVTYSAEPLTFMNNEQIALKPNSAEETGENKQITITVVDPKDPSKKPDAKFAPVFDAEDKGHSLVLAYSEYNENIGYYEDKLVYLIIDSVTNDTSSSFKILTCSFDKGLANNPTKLPNIEPVTKWRVGAYNKTRGFPKAAAMYEGRLFMANTTSYPSGIWGSGKLYNDWTDFYPGTNDADSVQFKIEAQFADEILWMVGQSKLFIGTRWGIYIAGSATFNDEAITPSNFRCRLFETVGASEIQPVTALDAVFFVDVSGRQVHEIRLSSETGAYEVSDISLLADDLLKSGIVSHAWQQTPVKTYWCAVGDGFLCSLTYLKNNGIMAWSKHVIGGKNVKVENIAVMHGDKHDLLWMIVRREINGLFVRHIEYMQPPYDPLSQEEFKQFYTDSGIQKEKKAKITNISLGKIASFRIDDSYHLNNLLNVYHNIHQDDHTFYNAINTLGKYSIDGNTVYLTNIDGSDYTGNSITDKFYVTVTTVTTVIDNKNFECRDIRFLKRNTTIYIESQDGASTKLLQGRILGLNGNKITLVLGSPEIRPGARVYLEFTVAKESYVPASVTTIQLKDYEFSDEEINEQPQKVYFNKINGTTQLNGKTFECIPTGKHSMRLVLDKESVKNWSPFDTVDPSGNAYFYFDEIEGLDHLKGQTISVCYNGNSGTDVVVPENGKIRAPRPVMYACAGLPIYSKLKTTPFAGGSLIGSSVGAVGGQKTMWLHLYYSLAGQYGDSFKRLYNIPYPNMITRYDKDQSLISGLVKCPMVSSGDVYNRCVVIEHNKPVSFNILSITQDIEVSDS